MTDAGLFVTTAMVAGILGGVGMELTLWVIGVAGWAKADMVVALGGLLTGRRENAGRVGAFVHVLAAIFFAVAYTAIMRGLGITALPESMLLGGAIGFVHGLVVSLGLVWVVAERHPLEEFNEASLAIGVSHLIGHVVYGIVTGVVVGISPF